MATGLHPPFATECSAPTRATLRAYVDNGLLPPGTVIPERSIEDHFDDLGDAETLYGRIDDYIRARYEAYSASRDSRVRGMGFIMTVYRRRLTSSFHAIRCSLQRRRDALARRATITNLLDDDDQHAAEGAVGLGELDESVLMPDPVGDGRDPRRSVDARRARGPALRTRRP